MTVVPKLQIVNTEDFITALTGVLKHKHSSENNRLVLLLGSLFS